MRGTLTRMSSIRRTAATLALAFVLLGCGSVGGTVTAPSANRTIGPPAATGTPVKPTTLGDYEDAQPDAEPLRQGRPPAPSLATTGEIPTLRPSDGPASRSDGERLAIAFLITYLNMPEDMGGLVDTFGAPTLDPIVGQYLVEDVRSQQLLRSDRHVPPGDIYWRVGEDNGEDRRIVEVVCLVEALDQTTWKAYQVIVVQGPEGWAVDGLTAQPGADPGVVELTDKTRKLLLSGPGWTRIAP